MTYVAKYILCACIINVPSVLLVARVLALTVALLSTPESCVKGPLGLNAPLTAKCIAVGCKIIPCSVEFSSYNLNTP